MKNLLKIKPAFKVILVVFITLMATTANAQYFQGNILRNKRLILWDGQYNEAEFYGFGIQPNELRYFVDQPISSHLFLAGTSPYTANELLRIRGNGNVEMKMGNMGIGTDASTTYRLSVKGTVNASNYNITSSTGTWSDYVFANDYKLPTLKETETFINANKHLPNFPSEAEIKEKGYTVHDMNNNFLKTIEEMTLHSIEQEKKINTMASELAEIKALLLQKK